MAAIFLSSTCALSFVRLILMEVSLVKTVFKLEIQSFES